MKSKRTKTSPSERLVKLPSERMTRCK
jgi:hypothetical protein